MTTLADDIRPKGTVEVRCGHPECGVAWWVDPLDPKLPAGPWDCGADHAADSRLRRAFAILRIRHGVVMGMMQALGEARPDAACECQRVSYRKGWAILHSREGLRHGFLAWDDTRELDDIDATAARIDWDRAAWPQSARDAASEPEVAPAGMVRWVGYKPDDGPSRRYTFVRCAREGCGHELIVDLERPDRKCEGYTVGGWGGGFAPEPRWWKNRSFVCEQGLSSFSPMPCRLRLSPMFAGLRQAQSIAPIDWSVWSTLGANRGSILFKVDGSQGFCVLLYEDDKPFTEPSALVTLLRIGTLAQIRTSVRERLAEGEWDDLLGVLNDALGSVS